ncbi:hypothetical protein [Mastigocoleus sp. MO_188.B34]|uniref:hypothetical protein n=1 Tax=Mastigocoleus sp. MO_188.B34 TaxID=3036635 RepID=UPI00262CD502|nr:hypothetical protein [Mastigocoleus sp. MO_188.B34]MDJ0695678.1 hypothetical protein [Mastigocoleus sp. MO_188.B34]
MNQPTKVVKLDLDNNKESIKKFGINSISAVLILKDGDEVKCLRGKAALLLKPLVKRKYLFVDCFPVIFF